MKIFLLAIALFLQPAFAENCAPTNNVSKYDLTAAEDMLDSFRAPRDPMWFGVVARAIRTQIEAGDTSKKAEKVSLALVQAGHTSLVACLGLDQRNEDAMRLQTIRDIASATKLRPVDWDVAFRGDRKTFQKFNDWLVSRRELLAKN